MKKIIRVMIVFIFAVILYSQLGSSKINELSPTSLTDSSWVSGVQVNVGVDSVSSNFRLSDLLSYFLAFWQSDISDSTQVAIDTARVVLTNSKAYTDVRETAITADIGSQIGDTLGQVLVVIPQSMNVKKKLYLGVDISNNYISHSGDMTTIFADTTGVTGELDVSGKATIDGYIEAGYVVKGKMRFADDTPIAVVLSGDDTYTRCDNENTYTALSTQRITNTAHSIVIEHSGDYTVSLGASLGCDQATAQLHLGIAVNGVVSSFAEREYSSKDAGDVGTVCLTEFPSLSVGDSLYAMVKSDSQSDSIRIKHFNFVVKRDN
jgi:hypothetical protein